MKRANSNDEPCESGTLSISGLAEASRGPNKAGEAQGRCGGETVEGRSRGSRSPIVRFSWDDIRARHSARSENEFKISQIRWIACEHSLGHSCLFERSHHRRIASSDHLSRFSLSPNRQVRPTPLCWLFLAFLPVVCVFRVLVSVDHLRSGSLLPTPWPGLSLERST